MSDLENTDGTVPGAPPGALDPGAPAHPSAAPPATTNAPAAQPPAAHHPPPRATRVQEGAWLAGVASGIARHLGWSVVAVRLAFVALGCMQMIGVFVYGLLWVLMPPAPGEEPEQAPGLEAAARRGMRPARSMMDKARRDDGALAGLVVAMAGVALLAQRLGTGPSSAIFWPLAFAAIGVGVVWRQADARQSEEALGGGWSAAGRMALGLGLVGVAVSMVAASQIGVRQLPLMLGLAALMLVGVAIAAAPWITRWRRSAQAAHERVLLDQARADMAAHLHDSVLQTLALIQRQAEDPKAVAQLARRQERELRAWLYGTEVVDGSLKAALVRAAGEIEDERGVEVELVCVGDCALDEGLQALVRATREAMMNAAKHSHSSRIDVYAEVDAPTVEVFVRDRGVGFDPTVVADDRMGVRRSIVERMERHGGTARIRTAPGEGTEVRLTMSVSRNGPVSRDAPISRTMEVNSNDG